MMASYEEKDGWQKQYPTIAIVCALHTPLNRHAVLPGASLDNAVGRQRLDRGLTVAPEGGEPLF